MVVHDLLAMYWKLEAKHGPCGAHLLRDPADVAGVATHTAWAAGLAALLVEIGDLRRRPSAWSAPTGPRTSTRLRQPLRRARRRRPDPNPDPAGGRKRDYYQRRSHNLISAFRYRRRHVLRYMYDLDVAFTTTKPNVTCDPPSRTERSGCYRSQHGAERFAHLRSYVWTTRETIFPPSTHSSACSTVTRECRPHGGYLNSYPGRQGE